ncbi:hypothetical protein HY971_02360 [Candidatus Kaiserbacteria bacterium]|nr:hypothetical protein [Candidatus Kaiserbacteria bacterium]
MIKLDVVLSALNQQGVLGPFIIGKVTENQKFSGFYSCDVSIDPAQTFDERSAQILRAMKGRLPKGSHFSAQWDEPSRSIGFAHTFAMETSANEDDARRVLDIVHANGGSVSKTWSIKSGDTLTCSVMYVMRFERDLIGIFASDAIMRMIATNLAQFLVDCVDVSLLLLNELPPPRVGKQ